MVHLNFIALSAVRTSHLTTAFGTNVKYLTYESWQDETRQLAELYRDIGCAAIDRVTGNGNNFYEVTVNRYVYAPRNAIWQALIEGRTDIVTAPRAYERLSPGHVPESYITRAINNFYLTFLSDNHDVGVLYQAKPVALILRRDHPYLFREF